MSRPERIRPLVLGPAAVAAVVLTLGVAAPGHADAPPGAPSNLGLCSPYLADLPAVVDPFTGETLGGNARSGVNLLIKRYGLLQPDQLANPGQLYSVRAHEHPTATAEDECLPRNDR
jgi:hypothetical protein